LEAQNRGVLRGHPSWPYGPAYLVPQRLKPGVLLSMYLSVSGEKGDHSVYRFFSRNDKSLFFFSGKSRLCYLKSHRLRQLSLCIGGLLSSPSSKTSWSQPSSPSILTSTHFSLCRSEPWNFLCEPCMFMLGSHSRVRIRGGTTSSSKL
jgi:hypothetical protein